MLQSEKNSEKKFLCLWSEFVALRLKPFFFIEYPKRPILIGNRNMPNIKRIKAEVMRKFS